ncbi:hypothetical protein EJ04DRAFT_449616 [Polyplosphaeria fusca]|uniref:non-specific serine/threonine protein kinase n=1 Tax=Polyplosphaeria fusca TaxID=682080 RepID=A0A9P4UWX6_9PLEO|nr:hypothetical protein EJ04DRAFT_449616 [Polyplosphaeria fusca]
MYDLIEDDELFEGYNTGFYYAVRLGEKFCSSRYQVVHKLGHGASLTSWLARDKRLAKYVKLKFSLLDPDIPSEGVIFRILRDGEGDIGKAHTDIRGTRNKHRCLVTTLVRISIPNAREASSSRLFWPSTARAIAAQVVQAVAFMHSRGVVHGGN